jgi:hypothetical protein
VTPTSLRREKGSIIMRNKIAAEAACVAILYAGIAGIVIPAAPVEATPARVTSARATPAETLMSAAGTPGVFLPGARGFTAGDGPPTSAQCLASYGIPCYSPLQVEQAYDLRPQYARGRPDRLR